MLVSETRIVTYKARLTDVPSSVRPSVRPPSFPEATLRRTRELKAARTTGTRGTKECQRCFHIPTKKMGEEVEERLTSRARVAFPRDTPVNASRV